MQSYLLLFLLSIVNVLIYDPPGNKQPIPEKQLEIQIRFPDGALQPMPCLNVNVLIINHTDTVASFFEDWNSWGYYNINFEIKTADTTYLVHKRDIDFTKNFPGFVTLFPGDSMELAYSLTYGYCRSDFNSIPNAVNHLKCIKAIYQQNKEALEDANLQGEIKYKRVYKELPANRNKNGKWLIVDSLKTPVEVNRTFPLSKLESREYELR